MGICPECKVRKGDDSPKELYKCPLCVREFCMEHLDPRLAFFSARFETLKIKDRAYREELEKEIRREDGHPCVPYTRRRIRELEYENKKLAEAMARLLDRSKKIVEIKREQPSTGRYPTRRYRYFSVPKWIGQSFFTVGLCLLLLTFLPQLITPILSIAFLTFLIYAWKSDNVWLKAIAVFGILLAGLVIWGMFFDSIAGLLFASEFLQMIKQQIDSLMTFLESIPRDYRIAYGIVGLIVGLTLWKVAQKRRRIKI